MANTKEEDRFPTEGARDRFERLQYALRQLTQAFSDAESLERDIPSSSTLPARYRSISYVLAAAIQLLEGGFCYGDTVDTDYYIPEKLNKALSSYGLCIHKKRLFRQQA